MKSRHLILVKFFFFGQQKFKCCVLIFYFFLAKPLRHSLKSLKKLKKEKLKKKLVSGILNPKHGITSSSLYTHCHRGILFPQKFMMKKLIFYMCDLA